MRVQTRWPALIPAIERAGHEPVLVGPVEEEPHPPWHTSAGFLTTDLPDPPVTARPRGAQRRPR